VITSSAAATGARPRAPMHVQFRLLLLRSWRQVSRAKSVLMVKAVQQVMVALIYGGIYSLDLSPKSAQDRIGLLSLVIIGGTNMGLAGTIRTFPKERKIVMEEQAKSLYSIFPYFVSKLLADVPVVIAFSLLFGCLIYPCVGLQHDTKKAAIFICFATLNALASSGLGLLLGSVASSTDAALAMYPPIIVLSVIFNGSNLSLESVPRMLRWIPNISLVRWGFEGMCINEFAGLVFDRPDSPSLPWWAKLLPRPGPQTGENILESLSFAESSVERCMAALVTIICVCWMLSLWTLQAKRDRRSAVMVEPTAIG